MTAVFGSGGTHLSHPRNLTWGYVARNAGFPENAAFRTVTNQDLGHIAHDDARQTFSPQPHYGARLNHRTRMGSNTRACDFRARGVSHARRSAAEALQVKYLGGKARDTKRRARDCSRALLVSESSVRCGISARRGPGCRHQRCCASRCRRSGRRALCRRT